MKRVRLDTWLCQLQPPRNPRLGRCPFTSTSTSQCTSTRAVQRQQHSLGDRRSYATGKRRASTTSAIAQDNKEAVASTKPSTAKTSPRKKSAFDGNVRIAKLSALHARLSLPAKLPLHTLARCLIDASADPHPSRNNASMALLGQDLLAYHTTEYLIVNYPRLPLAIMFAAQYAYSGPEVLSAMRSEWGVELAAAPGTEVDKALLQFKRMTPGNALAQDGVSQVKDTPVNKSTSMGLRKSQSHFRRGMTSRVVYDDEFGELRLDVKPYEGLESAKLVRPAGETTRKDSQPVTREDNASETSAPVSEQGSTIAPVTAETASATFIRALTGALYLHAGDEAVKNFHKDHILSRHLALHKLFSFVQAPRDLNRLCAREGFEPPVARLLSETGRLSRTPVFVVGIFSGENKIGEAAGASLNEARVRAASAALRAWYLYSPPVDRIMRPSDMQTEDQVWKPQMVDPGEIIV